LAPGLAGVTQGEPRWADRREHRRATVRDTVASGRIEMIDPSRTRKVGGLVPRAAGPRSFAGVVFEVTLLAASRGPSRSLHLIRFPRLGCNRGAAAIRAACLNAAGGA